MTTPPEETLRGPTAALFGLYRICLDSVRDARTPEAALAIRFALSELGTPYSQARRNERHVYDCSSFVSRAYQAAGVPIAYPDTPERVDGGPGQNTPGSRAEAAAAWSVPVTPLTAKPGDLVFFAGADPPNGHVGILLANGLFVHTNRTGDVAHVDALDVASVTAWRAVDPEKAKAVSDHDATAVAEAARVVRDRYEAAARDLARARRDIATARAERATVTRELRRAKNKQTIATRRAEDARARLRKIAALAYINGSSAAVASMALSATSVQELGRDQVLLRASGDSTRSVVTTYERARDAATREERALEQRLDAVDAQLRALQRAATHAQAALADARADPATPILGASQLSAADLVAWYRSTGLQSRTKKPIEAIAQMYLDESKRAGVRGDVAFAQAALDTAYFTFPAGGALSGTDNNLSLIGGCDTCQAVPWYASTRAAIRAQIQLLRVFADSTVTAKRLGAPPVIAGVLTLHAKGSAPTWRQLPGMALQAPEYGTAIVNLYRTIATWASEHPRSAA